MRLLRTAVVVLSLSSGMLHAQALPVGLPALPTRAADPLPSVGRALDAGLRIPLDAVRRARITELVRGERGRVDVDPAGQPVLRGELLAISPDPATLDAAARAGFDVAARPDAGEALGLEIVVLRDRRGRHAGRAMRDLRAAAPSGEFAFQHLYLPSGDGDSTPARPAVGAPARIGLVDGGVGDLPAVAGVAIRREGCGGRVAPDAHAVAVAARMVQARDTLYAADLWCGDRVGGATLGLVRALGWMARERVAVVNVSLVGPDNPVLARAVRALLDRGHVLVAAAGNDGPAAPPLYPAAYAGVIGVGAVDARLRVLPESASGPQVAFTAQGVVDGRTRGTSFAAPIVARLAASLVEVPSPDAAGRVRRLLTDRARDLGRPGRDARYGDGYLSGF